MFVKSIAYQKPLTRNYSQIYNAHNMSVQFEMNENILVSFKIFAQVDRRKPRSATHFGRPSYRKVAKGADKL